MAPKPETPLTKPPTIHPRKTRAIVTRSSSCKAPPFFDVVAGNDCSGGVFFFSQMDVLDLKFWGRKTAEHIETEDKG